MLRTPSEGLARLKQLLSHDHGDESGHCIDLATTAGYLLPTIETALSPPIPTGGEERARALLADAFGGPVHVEPREFLERVLAGLFRRQPDMSGDQRKRLTGSELRAVEETADAILRAITAALSLHAKTGEQP